MMHLAAMAPALDILPCGVSPSFCFTIHSKLSANESLPPAAAAVVKVNNNGSRRSSSNGRPLPRMVPIEEAQALLKKSANGSGSGSENGSVSGSSPASSSKVLTAGNNYNAAAVGNGSVSVSSAGTKLVTVGKSGTGSVFQNRSPNGNNVAFKRIKDGELNSPRKEMGRSEVNVMLSDEGFSWSREDYSKLERSLSIWSFIIGLRARIYLDNAKWTYVSGFTPEKQKRRRQKTASWLRESILQLGPAFIKLGQLSSTRSDLFPKQFVEELAKLQDRVPAIPSEKARRLLEKELGLPVEVIFREFEDQPIAAASLGQVHRAVLQTGEEVAVKIQRPGLRRLFDIDFENLKLVAELFQNSETFGGSTCDWVGVYEECRMILYQEIDYINEGRNSDRFRRDFRNIKWIRVPDVYWDYTSQKVLTMEYVSGIKINDIESLDAGNYDRALISKRSIEAYLIQILKTGFFHADPHPGNLAIDTDGTLIYYDFGMMGEIKAFTKDRLLAMFYATYEKDAKKVVQCLIDLDALRPTGDIDSVRRSVQFFLDRLLDQKPDQEETLSAIGEDLFAVAMDQPFRFPATFTFVLRAFTTLEGIGYMLNPDFSFAKIAAPYAEELLNMRGSPSNGSYFVQELQRQANEVRDATVAMPQRIQNIDEFIKQLESGDIKLRVRVLEAERAARRSSMMQMATLQTVFGCTFLNIGTVLTTQGLDKFATASFIGAGILAILMIQSMRRINRFDKYEKKI